MVDFSAVKLEPIADFPLFDFVTSLGELAVEME